ncbi:Cat8 [Sesbania bispinosa]|nr:Cat8 [Sesbania bispinosa]
MGHLCQKKHAPIKGICGIEATGTRRTTRKHYLPKPYKETLAERRQEESDEKELRKILNL